MAAVQRASMFTHMAQGDIDVTNSKLGLHSTALR